MRWEEERQCPPHELIYRCRQGWVWVECLYCTFESRGVKLGEQPPRQQVGWWWGWLSRLLGREGRPPGLR